MHCAPEGIMRDGGPGSTREEEQPLLGHGDGDEGLSVSMGVWASKSYSYLPAAAQNGEGRPDEARYLPGLFHLLGAPWDRLSRELMKVALPALGALICDPLSGLVDTGWIGKPDRSGISQVQRRKSCL